MFLHDVLHYGTSVLAHEILSLGDLKVEHGGSGIFATLGGQVVVRPDEHSMTTRVPERSPNAKIHPTPAALQPNSPLPQSPPHGEGSELKHTLERILITADFLGHIRLTYQPAAVSIRAPVRTFCQNSSTSAFQNTSC